MCWRGRWADRGCLGGTRTRIALSYDTNAWYMCCDIDGLAKGAFHAQVVADYAHITTDGVKVT